jgi:glycosyltransferase involved in cell wall biosynthesis
VDILPISVIIPAYKASRTIRRTLDSVCRQTCAPQEILVVDDGSPDREALAAALTSYGPRVRRLLKPNGGAASARNYGVDHAQAEWIAFLDADDYWEPEKLSRQFAVLRSHPDVGLVGCRWYEEEPPGAPRKPAPQRNSGYSDKLLRPRGAEAFEVAMVVWTGSLLVRRELLETDRFTSGLEPAEDRDLWIRLISKSAIYILPELLATYVQEPGGISRTNVDRDCGSMMKVIDLHAQILGHGVRRHQAIVQRRWAAEYLALGQPNRAFPHAVARLRLQPSSIEAWRIVLRSGTTTLWNRLFNGTRIT